MKNGQIKTRAEVKTEDTWDLSVLFPSDDAWRAAFETIPALGDSLAAYRGRLSDSADALLSFLKASDAADLTLEAIAQYASRKADEDTANAKYADMRGKVQSAFAEYGSKLSFVSPELLAIPDETLDAFYQACPALSEYRRYLDTLRRRRAHILSDAEERILAASAELAAAPENIYSMLQNADLRFPDVTDGDGVAHPLTAGSYITLMQSPDRVLRENTFRSFYAVFDSVKNTCAAALDAQVRALMFKARLRNYPDTLTASLDRTEVPTKVYKNLIETVRGHMDAMHRYLAVRQRKMGLDTLHMYDIYTPIVSESDRRISFAEAKETVLEALAPLGAEYLSILREGFQNRWIDVYENVGKRGGAYSSGARPHPYVLLNHKDTLDGEFTLAHEMGHALHSYLSAKHQPYVNSDYVIFVAEVASTCNEVLLMKHLLSKTNDKKERAYLINYFLEQFRTTLYRQTMFAEFEWEINRRAESGESLTADLLSEIYYDLNRVYYGEGMEIDREIALEWSRVPHFYYNFYVFQYATGFSAAVALAQRILTEGAPAVAEYLAFLSSGSAADPITLLQRAGVDMTAPTPIVSALSLFDGLITEFDTLLS